MTLLTHWRSIYESKTGDVVNLRWLCFIHVHQHECPGNTGKDYETIVNDTERDNFMTAQEAKEYGLVDEVITNVKEIEQ